MASSGFDFKLWPTDKDSESEIAAARRPEYHVVDNLTAINVLGLRNPEVLLQCWSI